MDQEININKIIARVDTLLDANENTQAENVLIEAAAKYAETYPNNIIGQSVLLNELGGFYRNRGAFDKGEAAYRKAKSLLEQIRGVIYQVKGPAPASGCCTCSGQSDDRCFCKDADTDEENQCHTEVVFTSESMTANYATTLNNLAGLYRMSGQLQKALDTFDEAIRVYESCSETVAPDTLASVYSNKGLVYLDMKQPEQARDLFQKAREILEEGGDYPFALGTTLSNLGFAAVIEEKFSEAIAFFQEAKALFDAAGNGEMVQNCAECLSQLGAEP